MQRPTHTNDKVSSQSESIQYKKSNKQKTTEELSTEKNKNQTIWISVYKVQTSRT